MSNLHDDTHSSTLIPKRSDEHGASATKSECSHSNSDTNNPFNAKFNKFVQKTLDEFKVPGISIAVIDGDDIFAKGYGFAALPNEPVTPETLFYAASTTKAHTAATIAQLINSGNYPELSKGWSTPIASIIRDDFVLQDEWATNHLTLADAVCHRTGIARHDHSWHSQVDGKEATAKDVVRNLRHLSLSVEPRVEFHYSNLMYIVLTHVIETLTGKRLEDVMKELIWAPLEMSSTFIGIEEAKRAGASIASSYRWSDTASKFEKMPTLDVKSVSGAGGIVSNVTDFAKWVKCLIHETDPFSKDVHKDIRSPRFPSFMGESETILYGLGWQQTRIHGEVAYLHSGFVHTMGSVVWWLPGVKYGVVAFENGAGTMNAAESIITQRLLEDKLQVPASKRSDISDELKRDIRNGQRDIQRAEQILFPNLPSPPHLSSLPPTKLAGEYFNKGYGSVILTEERHPTKPQKPILAAYRPEIRWGERWEMVHASGDFWTLYIKFPAYSDITTQFYSAKFETGVDGNVTLLEVDFYDQGEGIRQGLVQFAKVK